MPNTQNPTQINNDSRVRHQCQLAKQRENVGDYEGALTALSGVWSAIGERPRVEKLTPETQAEVLLRVGSVSSQLGSAQQISGAQEFAKAVITESQRLFNDRGEYEKSAEAKTDLALS